MVRDSKMAYAQKTEVPFDRSIGQILSMIRGAGAQQVGQMETPTVFAIQFVLEDRMVRFKVPLETLDETPKQNGKRQRLSQESRQKKVEQSKRQRARALLLVIKAKLESIESGIETFEQAFLAHVVMSDGETVYDRVKGDMAIEYRSGKPSMYLIQGTSGD